MNIWWLLLTIYLTDLMMGKGEKNGYKARKNLIQVEVQIQVQKDQGQDLQHYHHQDGITGHEN